MMNPAGIGPSHQPAPQALAHDGAMAAPDLTASGPAVAMASANSQNPAQANGSAASSTQTQLAQRGAQSADAGASSFASAKADAPQSQSAGGQAKKAGEGIGQFMKILETVGQSLAKIGQMVMDGIGKGLSMATSLISSVAGIAKSILPI